MKKTNKARHFINKPIYEGGLKALEVFVKKNLQYPKDALTNRIEGTVFIKYTINYKGTVIDAKVLKSLGYGCDEEALRIVRILTFKISKTRKVKIQFHKNIQIHFKLPTSQVTQTISYNYTQTMKTQDNDRDSNYDYTINIE